MFIRKIHTVEEDFHKVYPYLAFLFVILLASGAAPVHDDGISLLVLLLLIVVGVKLTKILRARWCRAEIMSQTEPVQGRIVGYRRIQRDQRGARGKRIYWDEFFLIIEVNGLEVECGIYDWPVLDVIASPEVELYSVGDSWHYLVDGFHYKTRRSDEGLPLQQQYSELTEAFRERQRRSWLFAVGLILVYLLWS